MALDRFCTSIDVSLQTLSASLFPDEELLVVQDGVGLYDGKEKSPNHFAGRLHLTSHRILFVASQKPHRYSLALELAHVRQTEYYAGFLKSSPKITLLLGPAAEATSQLPSTSNSSTTTGNFINSLARAGAGGTSTPTSASFISTSNFSSNLPAATTSNTSLVTANDGRSWICRVCGMSNMSSIKCTLCGITRDQLGNQSTSSTSTPSLSKTTSLRDGSSSSRSQTPTPPPPLPPLPSSVQLHPIVVPSREDPSSTFTTTLVDGKIPCPVCTFSNHHSMTLCEMCNSPLPSLRPVATTKTSSIGSRPSTPDSFLASLSSSKLATLTDQFVRLSFRAGGEREFYKVLKETLQRKAWDWRRGSRGMQNNQNLDSEGSGIAGGSNDRAVGGIDAIMKSINMEEADRDQSLDTALKDLESLMKRAKDMIQLAQSINERLNSANATTTTTGTNLDTTASTLEKKAASTLATSSLASLGLIEVTVTADSIKDNQRYHEELAKELATLLNRSDALVRRKGVVGLDELWCGWNRARGVALISPKEFRLAASYLPIHTSPKLALLNLPSGLTILHTSRYSPRVFCQRVWELLDLSQALSNSTFDTSPTPDQQRVLSYPIGLSTIEIAQADDESHGGGGEGIGIGLIKEMLEMIEAKGELCRDHVGAGGGGENEVRWFRNYFAGAAEEWDGTTFI